MKIRFGLLGEFCARVEGSPWKALGEDKAAQILAFLAFKSRFCSSTEIIEAVWGPDRLPGEVEELSEDGYKKQMYFVRDILTNVLGVEWQDYYHFQATGGHLKEGTFETDVQEFEAHIAITFDETLTNEDKLDVLQKADRLRRGFFLQGMHAPFINKIDGGARQVMSAQFISVHKQIAGIQKELDRVWGNRVAYCDNLYQAIPLIRRAIAEARHEVIFQGVDLRVMFPMVSDLLPPCVEAGVSIKFAMLDPDGQNAKMLAEVVRDDEDVLREECRVTLRRLTSLADVYPSTGSKNLVEVLLQDRPITAQSVAIDPQHSGGKLFLFPFISGIVPTRLAGYLWQHRESGPYQLYVTEHQRILNL